MTSRRRNVSDSPRVVAVLSRALPTRAREHHQAEWRSHEADGRRHADAKGRPDDDLRHVATAAIAWEWRSRLGEALGCLVLTLTSWLTASPRPRSATDNAALAYLEPGGLMCVDLRRAGRDLTQSMRFTRGRRRSAWWGAALLATAATLQLAYQLPAQAPFVGFGFPPEQKYFGHAWGLMLNVATVRHHGFGALFVVCTLSAAWLALCILTRAFTYGSGWARALSAGIGGAGVMALVLPVGFLVLGILVVAVWFLALLCLAVSALVLIVLLSYSLLKAIQTVAKSSQSNSTTATRPSRRCPATA